MSSASTAAIAVEKEADGVCDIEKDKQDCEREQRCSRDISERRTPARFTLRAQLAPVFICSNFHFGRSGCQQLKFESPCPVRSSPFEFFKFPRCSYLFFNSPFVNIRNQGRITVMTCGRREIATAVHVRRLHQAGKENISRGLYLYYHTSCSRPYLYAY